MKITLNDKEYTFLKDYQKDDKHRAAFNNLVQKIYHFSFEFWYEAGYWNEKYIPYTLFDDDVAVANVSINIMDFRVLGKQQRYIQIGTVMTDEKFRKKNLSKFLMDQILQEWNEKCDLIYLFANNTVLEFYPKFGFKSVKEYEHFCSVKKIFKSEKFEKLEMDKQADRDKLYDYAKNSKGFGKLSMNENADLVMFDCISFLKDSVYYSKSLDVIAVATVKENQLQLWDVFGRELVELDKILGSLADSRTNEIVFGFTPLDCGAYQSREIMGKDVLFIQKDKARIFDENKLMFPLMSHA